MSIGEKIKKLSKGLNNFEKLVSDAKRSASGEVSPERSSESPADPSGVNQNYTPKPTTPENIGYESPSSSESVSSTGSTSNMTPVVEESVITQEKTSKAIPKEDSLDKIISKLEEESGISKAKDYSEDESDSYEKSDTSTSSDEESSEDLSKSDESDESSEDFEFIEASDSDESDETEKAVYVEVNDLVKSVLNEEGITKKLSRIEKAIKDHETGLVHLSKSVVELAKAIRSMKNASSEPVRKSVPSIKSAENTLSKAIILDKMGKLVEKGELSTLDVIKFETLGVLSEEAKRKIQSFS